MSYAISFSYVDGNKRFPLDIEGFDDIVKKFRTRHGFGVKEMSYKGESVSGEAGDIKKFFERYGRDGGDNRIEFKPDFTFEEAAEQVEKLKKSPTNNELLDLYAIFMQGTIGDNKTDKPRLLDKEGDAKWTAWNGKQGISHDDAKNQYVTLVEQLIKKYGLQ